MPPLSVRRWPVRVRLVAAFIAVMVVVLAAAGAFVYWRVEVALDRTLNEQLAEQVSTVQTAWRSHPGEGAATVGALPPEALGQVMDVTGATLAATPAATRLTLLPADDRARAATGLIHLDPGNVLTGGKKRLRAVAFPLRLTGGARSAIAVTAVRLGQRDEALRELLAQLAIANLTALALASAVGYRLARATLLPVERYRLRAEQITQGAAGLRLEVPDDVDDEISRLGHTLNDMLASQEQAAERQRQFIADASHELRTPLTLLTAEVELALRRPRTNEEYQQTLQQVAVDTAHLVTLAEQLLDLEQSRTTTSLTPPTTTRQDLDAALDRATVRARSRLEPTQRTATYDGSPRRTSAEPDINLGLTPLELDLILGNLVDNAALHGTGDITLQSTSYPGWLVLTVHDQGDGPPPEFVAHAIERFRRADPSRTTPGNGLGLALVHALLHQAGGELRLCTPRGHHRYPPTNNEAPPCRHSSTGTTASALLPTTSDGVTCQPSKPRQQRIVPG